MTRNRSPACRSGAGGGDTRVRSSGIVGRRGGCYPFGVEGSRGPRSNVERFGPYELERRVAVGGMAEIFLARRCGPGGFAKQVALKRVLPELARQGEFRAMFADEARLCASLSHPGLVQVFDYGEVDGTPFLAMEWVDGCDLAALLAGGPLPAEAAAFLMAEVARTLAYVHTARDADGRRLEVVHRDLSPGNVLVSRGGDVKLGDFGVAKARGRVARTEAGQLKGTLAYLAPEQVDGGPVDPRTDVYAVGLLLFELVTGERYLRGGSEVELLKAAANPEPRAAAASFPALRIPRELDALLARALAPDPALRFPNAASLELELRKLISTPAAAAQARGLVAGRVCELAGGCGDAPRRQTEVVCVEPGPGPGRQRRTTALALAALGLALLSAGSIWAWLALAPPRPAPPVASAAVAPARPAPPSAPPAAPRAPGPAAPTPEPPAIEPAAVEPPPDRPRSRPAPAGSKAARPAGARPAAGDAGGADAGPGPGPERDAAAPAPVVEAGPDAAALLRAADRRRVARGLVAGDDAEADRLRARAADLVARAAPAAESASAVGDYQRRVESVAIDSAFIDRKMQRVSGRIRALDPGDPRAGELDALSREALRRAMAGDFVGANGLLNRILQQAR